MSLFLKSLKPLKGKSALVTGASAGIGYTTALYLAAEGVNLFLTARRQDKLEALKRELQSKYPSVKVEICPGDISALSTLDKLDAQRAFSADILINNAGLALGADPVATALSSDWDLMIKTNVSAAFEVARRSTLSMIKKKSGHVVNIASIAGHYSYEGGSVYCATKHALIAFTRSLRMELCDKNIRVSIVSPGMVETEFSQVRFNQNIDKAKTVYSGFSPLTAEDISSQIVYCLMQKDHVNVDEILVMPLAQGSIGKVHREK